MFHNIARLLRAFRFFASALFMFCFLAGTAEAITLPADFEDGLVATIGAPTALAFTPDGRLLITTQSGQVRVYQNKALLGTPALNLSAKICTNSERGVLGIAVDPNFTTNQFIYLYYTFNKPGNCNNSTVNRVARFVLSANNIVDPASETVLIDNIHSPAGNHNGGDLHFGKDDLLYVSVGDGGCDYAGNSGCAGSNDAARDRHVMLGKILRITRDGAVPAGNPYQGANSGRCSVTGSTTAGNWCQETFASGLRNPFRIAFDSNALNTRFFINDVGQGVWEEIDEGIAGADYGWNIREGHCANNSTTNCSSQPTVTVNNEVFTNPIFDYQHTSNCSAAGVRGNSITGGAFVPNGVWSVGYDNSYLVGEYVCGKIFKLTPNGSGGYRGERICHRTRRKQRRSDDFRTLSNDQSPLLHNLCRRRSNPPHQLHGRGEPQSCCFIYRYSDFRSRAARCDV
jgi:glucose/arabinose dehydrogenase